jgi:hypothetical protein
MVGFYCRFIERSSQIAELHALKRKNVRFLWGDAQLTADASSTFLVLQIPDVSSEFTLVCDASDVAISAVLHQKKGEDLEPIAYSSRLLPPTEKRYSFHEECLAVMYGCEKCRTYLEHTEFFLHTNDQALAWLLQHAKELSDRT